jgi:hypothetical protein
MRRLEATLTRFAYRFADELQLHEAIAEVLTGDGIAFKREHIVDAKSRADFWIDGTVIEVKIAGSFADAFRQCQRYGAHESVAAVLLATTKVGWARGWRPSACSGKPFSLVVLPRASL